MFSISSIFFEQKRVNQFFLFVETIHKNEESSKTKNVYLLLTFWQGNRQTLNVYKAIKTDYACRSVDTHTYQWHWCDDKRIEWNEWRAPVNTIVSVCLRERHNVGMHYVYSNVPADSIEFHIQSNVFWPMNNYQQKRIDRQLNGCNWIQINRDNSHITSSILTVGSINESILNRSQWRYSNIMFIFP